MKLINALVLAGLLSVNGVAHAGTPSSSTPTTTTSSISQDLFDDGSVSVSKTYAGDKTFTDNYTFNLNAQRLQEFNSLSATLNYTNSNSVGCALLIFCGTSNSGFSNLNVTLTSPSGSSTSGTTTTGPTNTSVFVIPILVWSATTSTQNTVSTDWISLLATGTYTLSVSGTTLKNGGGYSLGVTAVPEPQTAALAALGLGLIGMIARRRRV
ncbi:FxDxF family PEP-CTERM protein [Methylophilus sp. TWE2]|uniref:FxDxF family PEP-CTERM protein n=1 Tax=Methylophilus sp. TWE2 TaxID=1662285 RepID=UPI0009E23B83|nr:FxDxF family PEP-CTERM protein [Methylophilus sp. TWE2]